MKRTRLVLLLVFGMLAALLPAGAVSAATGDPVLINEVLASTTSLDVEYVELYGTPGLNLSGLSLIVVEGDAFGPGTVDRRFDFKPFHTIGSNGFFLVGGCARLGEQYGVTPDAALFSNYLENSSLTVALFETENAPALGSVVTGAEPAADSVALTDGDAGDLFYFGAPVIGPDGPFFPAGARRVADGVDTDLAADWVISSFSLPGDNTPLSGGFDGCAPIPLTIPEIQGDGQFSIYDGEVATTIGVVTAITANGRDMWIQDVSGDGNPATSDGIFVDDRDRLPDPKPEVGDLVMLTADVQEQQFGSALPRTILNNPDDYPFTILSSGHPLPSAVKLEDLPNVMIPDGEAFWEPLEGMLVMVENAPVTSATNGFGEFGMLTKQDAKPGSGFFPQTSQIIVQDLGDEVIDYNPERIIVDDSTIEDAIQVRPGDRVRSLTGVVDYTFSMYKLQPTDWDVKTQSLPKREALSTRSGGMGDTVITTFNVENLFDLIDNPDKDDIDTGGPPTQEALDLHLAKLALAIEIELGLPDIIVLQEVENQEIAQALGDLVNLAAGTNYMARSFETSDGRGIEVAFLYDDDRVDLNEVYQLSGADVEMWFGPTSPSPGREPLYGEFQVGDSVIHIVGNHFKSKGGDDPLYGVNWPPVRVTEVQRKGQAQVVRDFVNDVVFDSDPDAMVMVTGDLNDFQFSEPGEGADNPVAIVAGDVGEVPLYNLINLEKAAERWTFVFDGNSQVLDHMLVSPALLEKVAGADVLHFNTPINAAFEFDPTSALAASDHDPLEGRFSLR